MEIETLGKQFKTGRRIKIGETKEINEEIYSIVTDKMAAETDISIAVIEKDMLFNDTGKINAVLKINVSEPFPQKFEYTVPVTERRKVFWKKKAVFTVIIQAELKNYGNSKNSPTMDNPKWTGNFKDDSPEMVLARAIFGEARGASRQEKIAVGWVVRNRVEDPKRRWGETYHDVILQAKQFSAFNQNDPNRALVEDPLRGRNERDKKAWIECRDIAGLIISSKVSDPTYGANHYYDKSIANPPWATQATFRIKIGSFHFHEL